MSIKEYGDVSLQTVRTSGDLSDKDGDVIAIRNGQYQGQLQPKEMLTLQTVQAASDEPQTEN